MPTSEPRVDGPPLWWKVVAGLVVMGFVVGVWCYVEWRSAPPPVPKLAQPLP